MIKQEKKFGPIYEDGKYRVLNMTLDNSFNMFYRSYLDGELKKPYFECYYPISNINYDFPEFTKFYEWIDFSIVSGPLHYIANTLFHAGNRDHWGLRKGEISHIKVNGEYKYELKFVDKYDQPVEIPTFITREGKPPTINLRPVYMPVLRVGEGKERDLDWARASAMWPDATDEELMADDLEQKLIDRLPGLIELFKADMKKIGFDI